MKQVFLYGGIMAILSIGLFALYYNAGRFKNTYEEINETRQALNSIHEDIMASQSHARIDSSKWFLNKWEMYHTLTFETGNILRIDNHIDTVLRYTYKLSNDTLWLKDANEAVIANKIKSSNNQELVFENFIGTTEEVRYSRIQIQKK